MAQAKIPIHILEKQAQMDYENARGTAHLKMLLDAYNRYNLILERCESQIQKYNHNLNDLIKKRSNELSIALSKYIVVTELIEVDGIGVTLQNRILSQVFKSSLDDLFRSYELSGIGEEKQWAISYWVRSKQRDFLNRLEGDFPNKQNILDKYRDFIDDARHKIGEFEQLKLGYKQILDKLKSHIDMLQEITIDHFTQALIDPHNYGYIEKIDQYIKGVFAEWEEIPLWFQRLVLDSDNIYTKVE